MLQLTAKYGGIFIIPYISQMTAVKINYHNRARDPVAQFIERVQPSVHCQIAGCFRLIYLLAQIVS